MAGGMRRLLRQLLLLPLVLGASSRAAHAARARAAVRMMPALPSNMARGIHGQGSRFMSIVSLYNDDYAPRLMPVAGMLPHVTLEQLRRPVNPPAPGAGRWKYYKLDNDQAPFGFVCVECPEALAAAVDPVVVVALSSDLGIPLVDGKNDEVLVFIDRGDPAVASPDDYEPGVFYAFADASGQIDIAWQKEYPTGAQTLAGRVLYVYVPYVEPKVKPATGFAEMSDEFNF